MDRFGEMIHAMGDVVRKGGFGTSVTPVSQFYFQQAFNNVLFGPWKKIAEGYGKMVLGYYGKTPVEPDPEVVRIASEELGLKPTDVTPLELDDANPKKGLKAAAVMLDEAGIEKTDENLFIAATCKEKGVTFLKGEAKLMIRKNEPPASASGTSSDADVFTVDVNGTSYVVQKEDGALVVDGNRYQISVSEGGDAPAAAPSGGGGGGEAEEITAPMPGSVFKVVCKEGDSVAEGDQLVILEAMKMEVPVKAPKAGTVASLLVAPGDAITSGQVLLKIS